MDGTVKSWGVFLVTLSVFTACAQAQAACSLPAGVANAEILTSPPYSHGSLVTYRCLSGFSMTGSPSQQCNNGAYQGTAPTCSYRSTADTHEQAVDLTDPTTDNSLMYGMGALIGVVFLVMLILLVIVLIIICRRAGCCGRNYAYDEERPRKVQIQTPETERRNGPRMAQIVDRVMANNRRSSNHPHAKEIQGWKPFARPTRDNNTSTK